MRFEISAYVLYLSILLVMSNFFDVHLSVEVTARRLLVRGVALKCWPDRMPEESDVCVCARAHALVCVCQLSGANLYPSRQEHITPKTKNSKSVQLPAQPLCCAATAELRIT